MSDTSLPAGTDAEKNQIEIWKKVVDVQQHFNDIELRIRNIAFTFLGVVVAGVGLSMKEKITIDFIFDKLPLAALLLIVASLIFLGFWFMDRHWYHRLLYGAVKQGQLIEKELERAGYIAGLTKQIGDESPIVVFGSKLRSTAKIDLFYWIFFFLLLIPGAALMQPQAGVIAAVIAALWGLVWFVSLPEK